MESSKWKACALAILPVLIGFAVGLGKEEEQYRYNYIHGHPLLSGTGVRGAHLNGYVNHPHGNSGERGYHHNPQYPNYHHPRQDYKSGSDYHQGYPPYTGYPPYKGYPPYQGYSSEESYGHPHQEYPHFPHQERYPHHNNGYSSPPHIRGYPPQPSGYPYDFHLNYYSGEDFSSKLSRSEEDHSTVKAIDTEIHASKPKDKVLYISDTVEKIKEPESGVLEQFKRDGFEKKIKLERDESKDKLKTKGSDFNERKFIDPRVSKDYSGYSSGYSPRAPEALDNTFCRGLTDGNFANPGLTQEADPRCTYVTCAGQRPILFNCAPGTFNGRHVDYHVPLWDSPNPDYEGAPHHRFEAYGKDLCGQLDVASDGQSPVCSGISIVSAEVPFADDPEKDDKTEEYSDIYSIEPTPSMEDANKKNNDKYKKPEAKDLDTNTSKGEQESSSEDSDVRKDVSEKEEMGEDKKEEQGEQGKGNKVEREEGDIKGELKFVPGFVHPHPEVSPPGPESVPAPDIIARPPEGKSLKEQVKSYVLGDYADYKHGYGMGPTTLDLDFCANMEDGNYANPGLTLEADPRCTYVTCSSGRAYIFNCPLGTYNGKDYKHHFPLWGSDVTTFARAYHFRYGKKEVCRAEDKDAVCSR